MRLALDCLDGFIIADDLVVDKEGVTSHAKGCAARGEIPLSLLGWRQKLPGFGCVAETIAQESLLWTGGLVRPGLRKGDDLFVLIFVHGEVSEISPEHGAEN